jgi:hypothetical protein
MFCTKFLTAAILIFSVFAFTSCEDGATTSTGSTGGGNTTSNTGIGNSYVDTVRQIVPYESIGITASYSDVVSRFITSPRWNARTQSSELTFVDLSGTVTDVDGTDLNIVITFRVTPFEGREGVVWVEPIVLEISGRFYSEDAANEFVYDLFIAFDEDFNSLSGAYRIWGIDDGIANWYLTVY